MKQCLNTIEHIKKYRRDSYRNKDSNRMRHIYQLYLTQFDIDEYVLIVNEVNNKESYKLPLSRKERKRIQEQIESDKRDDLDKKIESLENMNDDEYNSLHLKHYNYFSNLFDENRTKNDKLFIPRMGDVERSMESELN
jgi:hypothetical protein